MSVEGLATYLPMDRRHAIAAGKDLPDRLTGSVLLADISGFTPLTEALVAGLGPRRGADELTKLLNAVYTSLVSRVHHFGGSVVCFIGDALTCHFADDTEGDDNFRRRVRRADNRHQTLGRISGRCELFHCYHERLRAAH